MAYGQTAVLVGGLVHVPIVIAILGFFNNVTGKRHRAEMALKAAEEQKQRAIKEAEDKAKAKADAEAKAKAKRDADAAKKAEELKNQQKDQENG